MNRRSFLASLVAFAFAGKVTAETPKPPEISVRELFLQLIAEGERDRKARLYKDATARIWISELERHDVAANCTFVNIQGIPLPMKRGRRR